MDSVSFVKWLKQEDLFWKVQDNYQYFSHFLTKTLRIRLRNELVIIGDIGRDGRRAAPIMAGCYLLAAKRLGLNYKFMIQDVRKPGDSAEQKVISALQNLQEENYIALALSGKLGRVNQLGTNFRKYVRSRRVMFVSTPSLMDLPTSRFRYLIDSIDIDYEELQREARRLERILNNGREVRLITDKGTNLTVGITGMQAIPNDGKFHTKSGNIPVGEVYLAPKKYEVDGRVVIDGSVRSRYGTHIVDKPVILRIEKGSVTSVSGDESIASKLRESIRWAGKPGARIGELGIGINPKAKVIGPTIINEKAKGTAHIALGNNSSFGGNIHAKVHLDQVFRNPKIWVDGRRMI